MNEESQVGVVVRYRDYHREVWPDAVEWYVRATEDTSESRAPGHVNLIDQDDNCIVMIPFELIGAIHFNRVKPE